MSIHLPSKALENASRKLQKVLKAPTEGGVLRRQTRGRIDARRVHRAPQGQADFRKRKWVREQFTTAVTIVLDFSSSMSRNMAVLQASTRALCRMLERSGNPYNVYAFGDEPDDFIAWEDRNTAKPLKRQKRAMTHGDRGRQHVGATMTPKGVDGPDAVYERIHATRCALWEIIGERDTLRSRETQVRKINAKHAQATTPDAAALVEGIRINAAMQADRHIVIMLTDGCGWGKRLICAATKYANSLGVETVGISLNSGHIREGDGQYNACATAHTGRRHSKGRVVTEADALTKGFFESLSKQLGKGVTRKSRVMLG